MTPEEQDRVVTIEFDRLLIEKLWKENRAMKKALEGIVSNDPYRVSSAGIIAREALEKLK